MTKSIIVIGAGIAGLSTGCCGQMNGYLTRNVINHVQKVITDENYRQEMVDHNYDMGKALFSYAVLRRKLRSLIPGINYTAKL